MSKPIIIKGRLPSLNQYIAANNRNRFISAKMKKDVGQLIGWQIRRIDKIYLPADYTFHWFVKNKRSDPDNIAYAVKFIFDALQEYGKLDNDGFNNVLSISHTFAIDPDERVEVVYNYRHEA